MPERFEVTGGYELEEDGVRVEVTYIGEGWSGEYDEDDPDDEPLCRFYVSVWDDDEQQWVDIDDGSYCTRLPAWNDKGQEDLARIIMNRVGDSVRSESPYKRDLEELSWFDGREDA